MLNLRINFRVLYYPFAFPLWGHGPSRERKCTVGLMITYVNDESRLYNPEFLWPAMTSQEGNSGTFESFALDVHFCHLDRPLTLFFSIFPSRKPWNYWKKNKQRKVRVHVRMDRCSELHDSRPSGEDWALILTLLIDVITSFKTIKI